MTPLMKIGEIDLATSVHVLAHLDLHVRGGFHECYGSIVGVGVEQSHGYWYVVSLTLVRDWNCSHQVEQLSVSTIVEGELVTLGSETLVVEQQS